MKPRETHAPDCLGHSECSCALPRFKARVAKLLRRLEVMGHQRGRHDDGYCEDGLCACCGAKQDLCEMPEYSRERGRVEHRHVSRCALAALLKECEE